MPSQRTFLSFLFSAVFLLLVPATAFAAEFYVSPTGSATNTGTISSPWDLQTAFNHPKDIQPGDIIYLRGGTYSGSYKSVLTGTATSPIKVRSYPGEAATLDWNHSYTLTQAISATDQVLFFDRPVLVRPADMIVLNQIEFMQVSKVEGNKLTVNRGWSGTVAAPHAANSKMTVSANQQFAGNYTWYMDLVITNSYSDRTVDQTGSNPPDRRVGSVTVTGIGNKVINNVIHNTANGIEAFSGASETEIYGNIITHVGWYAEDRLHGHGMYMQNTNGTRWVKENIVFNAFGNGLSQYGSELSVLDNFYYEGNVFFNDRFLWGGNSPIHNLTLKQNFFFTTGNYDIGWGNPYNDGALLENNYFFAQPIFKLFKNVTLKNNTWGNPAGSVISLNLDAPDNVPSDYTFSGNTYYRNNTQFPFATFRVKFPDTSSLFIGWDSTDAPPVGYGGETRTWTETFGYDTDGTFIKDDLSGVMAFVRPNAFNSKRANVVIYNWDKANTITIPASEVQKVLKSGDSYELINTQDYFNDKISGTYSGGDISIDMVNRTTSTPIGYTQIAPSTFPGFGVFMLNNLSGSTSPSPAPSTKLGDANDDNIVDGIDYVRWLNNYQSTTAAGSTEGDFNNDGTVDGRDYVVWLNNYGK